jgi:TPR repeat protein
MSPWQELAIAPTADAGAIRKAYAAKLKLTRPEDDPAGFARLRAAYETALKLAAAGAASEAAPPPAAAPSPTGPVPPAAARLPSPEPVRPVEELTNPKIAAAIRDIAAALDRRDGETAAGLLLVACADGILPLRTEFALKDRLAAVLLADRQIPAQRLLAIARDCGWHDEADALRSGRTTAQGRLCARIDLELSLADRATPRPAAAPRTGGSGLRWIWLVLVIGGMIVGFVSQGVTDRRQPGYAPSAALQPLGPGRSQPGLPILGQMTLPHLDQPLAQSPDGGVSDWKIDTDFGIRSPVQVARDRPGPAANSCDLDLHIAWPSIPLGQREIFGALGREAEGGVARSQNAVGLAYLTGDRVERDEALAFAWFRLAASRGNIEAHGHLAELCRRGRGVAPDAAAARQLYRQAAEASDDDARLGLAEMLLAGEGGAADPAEAFALLGTAAMSGNPAAMARLGELYRDGTGTARDPASAAQWSKAAAERGSAAAMYDYAELIAHGTARAADKAEAYRWFALAARFGDAALQAKAGAELAKSAAPLTPQQRAAADRSVAAWRAKPPG